MSRPCMWGSMLGGSAVLANVSVPPGLACARARPGMPAAATVRAAAPPARKRRRSMAARPRVEECGFMAGRLAFQRELLEGVAARRHAAPALGEGPRNLGHVDVAARVHRDTVRGREAPGRGGFRRTPPGEQPPVLVEHADAPVERDVHGAALPRRSIPLVPPQLGDVRAPLGVEDQVGGSLRIGPLGEVLAVRAEDLDAIVLAVADEDPAVRGGRDAVREIELTGAGAGHAPRALPLAARAELVHAAVAVAVRDVEITLRPDREIRGTVEAVGWLRDRHVVLAVVAGVRGLVHGTQGHQELALRRELPHGVVAVVGAVEALVGADGDAVGAIGELALAPRAQELAVAVVCDDRVVTAADEVDAVLGIDRHARHVAVRVALRQLLPALDHLIRQCPRSRHWSPPGSS